MNYLAHAFQHLDRPYFAAGTALPDWMSMLDRKNRARRQYAEPVSQDVDPEVADFASGVVQHHVDDFWFHSCPAFLQLSSTFAAELRAHLEAGMGHQAAFVGHISVELLLDAVLLESHPALVDDYYSVLASVDYDKIQHAANLICRNPVLNLVGLIPRFISERFLADYSEDRRLLMRLNGVMKRVGLPKLPEQVAPWLASARPRVRDSAEQLLTSP